jgi:ribosomal protein S18 acetylase RimI-like enzyme
MTSCLIRPATLRDAKAIAEIHVASVGASGAGAALGVDRQQVFWREAIEFGEPQLQVACVGEEVVGFVGFDRCRDPGTPPTLGEIWAIRVAASHWGQGVGLALWDATREGLLDEGCTDVSVWVALDNQRALRFLQLAGFKRELSSARTAPAGAVRVEEIRLKRKL